MKKVMMIIESELRVMTAKVLVPVMKATGYRFGHEHGDNETIQYRLIDVVLANLLADGIKFKGYKYF